MSLRLYSTHSINTISTPKAPQFFLSSMLHSTHPPLYCQSMCPFHSMRYKGRTGSFLGKKIQEWFILWERKCKDRITVGARHIRSNYQCKRIGVLWSVSIGNWQNMQTVCDWRLQCRSWKPQRGKWSWIVWLKKSKWHSRVIYQFLPLFLHS